MLHDHTFDPAQPSMYAVTEQRGVFRSTDAGTTWHPSTPVSPTATSRSSLSIRLVEPFTAGPRRRRRQPPPAPRLSSDSTRAARRHGAIRCVQPDVVDPAPPALGALTVTSGGGDAAHRPSARAVGLTTRDRDPLITSLRASVASPTQHDYARVVAKPLIMTPDRHLRVFISSTLHELAVER